MSVQTDMLKKLTNQLDDGFLIAQHWAEEGAHHFVLPALEYSNYVISVPEGPELTAFMASQEFQRAQMRGMKVGVALLDLVGFSANADDTQLKMIVRYQCEIRKAIAQYPVARTLSIGDGTIFVFEEAALPQMASCLLAIDHAIGGFNLDFKGDGVPKICHRIGVHVGNAYCFKDINKDLNYIGTGINMAQRVASCIPDSGSGVAFKLDSTIYVSEEARTEMLKHVLPDGVIFNDAGIKEAKHGVKLHVHAMFRVTVEKVVVSCRKVSP